ATGIGGGIEVILAVHAQNKRVGDLAVGEQRVAVGLGGSVGGCDWGLGAQRGEACKGGQDKGERERSHRTWMIAEGGPLGEAFRGLGPPAAQGAARRRFCIVF